jgi:hypothetical protein
VFIDSVLNIIEILLANGSFSDGNGQHDDCISESNRRRQQKMHEIERKLQVGFDWKFDESMG